MSTTKIKYLYPRGKNHIYWINLRFKGHRIHESTRTSNLLEALAILEIKKNALMEQLKARELTTPKEKSSSNKGLYTQETVIDDISRVMASKKDVLTSRSLYLRGRNYWMRFRYKGQRIHQSTKTSSKEKAMILLLDKKYEILLSPRTKPTSTGQLNDIIFEDASILAFHHHFSRQRSVSVKAYKLGVLCNILGDWYVSQISQSTFVSGGLIMFLERRFENA